jgi:hypothetical protein
MNAKQLYSPTTELRGNLVLLRADSLRLLLPQGEVGAARHLNATPMPGERAGLFKHEGTEGNLTLIALSGAMRPLSSYPAVRFVITPMRTTHGVVMFAWDEVSVLIGARLPARPVPAGLVWRDSTVQHFVEMGDKIAFCCNAQKLTDFALEMEP